MPAVDPATGAMWNITPEKIEQKLPAARSALIKNKTGFVVVLDIAADAGRARAYGPRELAACAAVDSGDRDASPRVFGPLQNRRLHPDDPRGNRCTDRRLLHAVRAGAGAPEARGLHPGQPARRRSVRGLDDPLEILKIVHQPPKPDRLIRYAQPSRPTDVLYAELGFGPDRRTRASRADAAQEGRYRRGASHRGVPRCVRIRGHQLVAAGVHPARGVATGVRVSSRRAEDSRFADAASRSCRGTRRAADGQASLRAGVGGRRTRGRTLRRLACEATAVGSGSAHPSVSIFAASRMGAVAGFAATQSVSRGLLSAHSRR